MRWSLKKCVFAMGMAGLLHVDGICQLAPLSVQVQDTTPEVASDLGWAVAAGDINGDGYADAVIGAIHSDAGVLLDAGRVLVRFGPAFTAELSLTAPVPQANADFGTAVACGDLDGDGFAEVIVGSPDETVAALLDMGRVYVFHGPALTTVTAINMPLGTISADFGRSLALGDVTGDSQLDLVIGAPEANVAGVLAGKVFVFDGPTLALVSTLSHPAPSVGDQFGWAVAAGDTDGDGAAEVIVGIPNEQSGGLIESGAVAVYSAPALASWVILTEPVPELSAEFGRTVAAGDLNGDGLADLAVGVTDARPLGIVDAGEVVVFLGPTFAAPVNLTEPVMERGADFGSALAIADADGDGTGDLLVGAEDATSDGEPDAGRAYLFHGPALSVVTELIPDVIHNGDDFGFSAAFGDFNDDGLMDFLVGAKGGEVIGPADEGRAFALIWQNDLGLSATALSASLGGTINFSLAGGAANSSAGYALLASHLGNSPCFQLAQVCIPIAYDPLLTNLFLTVVPGALGTLNAAGNGSAFLPIPAGVLPGGTVGLRLTWAWVNRDTRAYASRPVVFEITP